MPTILSFDLDGVLVEADFNTYSQIKEKYGQVSKEMLTFFRNRRPRQDFYPELFDWIKTVPSKGGRVVFTSARGGWLEPTTCNWLDQYRLFGAIWLLTGWKDKGKCLKINYPNCTIIHVDEDPRIIEVMRSEDGIDVVPVYLKSWEDIYAARPELKEECHKTWQTLTAALDEKLAANKFQSQRYLNPWRVPSKQSTQFS